MEATDARIRALVQEMANGLAVVAVYRDMRDADHAWEEARRWCEKNGVQYAASRCNGRIALRSSTGGSIRFTSERAQLRGCKCDVFSIDGRAVFREWMAPLRAMAMQRFETA